MKLLIAKSMAGLAMAASIACAGSGSGGKGFGIGVVLPMPTGISAKLWTGSNTALDFVVGWSGYRGGYRDNRCYDEGFYKDNRGYCNDVATDWRDYDNRYYRGRNYGWRTFHLHGNYLFHNFTAIRSKERIGLFYGPGIQLEYWRYEEAVLGVRGNFGICWLPRRAPMDLYFEVAPVVNLFPAGFFEVNAGLGTRFYF